MSRKPIDDVIRTKLRAILNHPSIVGEFTRYLIVGGIAFIADYGVLILLNKTFGVHYLIAATVAFVIGIGVNYLGSVKFVFYRRGVANVHIERALFLLIGILGLILNDGMLFLLTGQLGIGIEFSKPISQIVVLLWNFLARKFLLFSGRKSSVEI